MTVCVYHNDVLAADSLVTLGGLSVNESYVKIGKIYQDVVSKKRSVNKDDLQFPEEFAMYAVAGSLRFIPRFLRWFVTAKHPGVDHNLPVLIDDYDETEDAIEVMVIFKDYNIVRLYDSEYMRDLFVDYTKNVISAIGAGIESATAILAYDPNASLVDVLEAVKKVQTSCGGQIETLCFGETFVHDKEELEKAKRLYVDEESTALVESLAELGIEIKFQDEDEPEDNKNKPKYFL